MAAPVMPEAARRYRRGIALGLGLSSGAVLVFEITLTRVFAITQFNHFVFVTVSLALLGFGASGSLLTAFPALGRGGPRRWALLATGQSLSILAAYAIVNEFPFDSFSIAWDTGQIWLLVFNYFVLSLPFLLGGLVIAILLVGADQEFSIPSNRVYAYSLVGSGAGCVVAVGGLGFVGGVGMVIVSAAAAMLAAVLLAGPRLVPGPARLALTGAAGLLLLLALFPPPFLDLKLSPYKALSVVLRFPGAEVVSTRWTAGTRVEHIRSDAIRSLPGLSFAYAGNLPRQDGLTFDGDDLSPVPLLGWEQAEFAQSMLTSLPFSLRPGGHAAVLQPRGGLDVLVALAAGAGRVTAVEPDRHAVRAVSETGFSAYDDDRVATEIEDPRVFLERTRERYDVIDVALTAPYRPVASGAYSLSEDYALTTGAFATYLSRLDSGGILAVMSWLQVPPSEETRLIALAAEAVRAAGGDPVDAVVALRGYANLLVMVQPDGFHGTELAAIAAFGDRHRFDLVAAPGLEPAEANRYNRLPEDEYFPLAAALLATENPSEIYAGAAFDIAPPTDDHPFFGHFFKWSQTSEVLDTFGKTWQPFGGAGYFVVLAVLVLAGGAALLLILGPLALAAVRRDVGPAGPRLWTVAYFGLLGLGFLFVEIPIIQRYILLIGRPTTAFAVVLFALLVASGLGSMQAPRLPWRRSAVALALLAAFYPWLLRLVTDLILAWPLIPRMSLGALALVPVGFLMGTMFPHGLRYLERRSPELVPWAWAINGVLSVISSVAATLLALSFGFSIVMLAGAACYGLCALAAQPESQVSSG